MTEADVDLHTLQQSVTYALEALPDQATITEAEVCATWCERHTVRIQYDAERPSRGVHTPQVQTTFGLGMLLVIEDQDGRRVGFGSESGDLSLEGLEITVLGDARNLPEMGASSVSSSCKSSSCCGSSSCCFEIQNV